MLWLVTVILCVILSAFFNAIADRLENAPAFNTSVFYKKNPKFWLKETSWQYAKKIFAYKIDAWHLVESAQVVLFILAALLFYFLKPITVTGNWWKLALFCGLGLVYNFTFNYCYNKLLKRKPNGN